MKDHYVYYLPSPLTSLANSYEFYYFYMVEIRKYAF